MKYEADDTLLLAHLPLLTFYSNDRIKHGISNENSRTRRIMLFPKEYFELHEHEIEIV